MSPAPSSCERLEFLSANEIDGADAFGRSRVGIEDAHAGFETAAHDAQIVHLAHERVDRGLEDLCGEGAVGGALNADDRVLCEVGRGLSGAFCGLGEILDDLVHQVDDALVLERASCHNGNDVDVENSLADAVDHVLAREEALLEVLFKQQIVVFRRRLGESELHFFVLAAVFFWNGDLLGSRAGEMIRLAGQGVRIACHLFPVHNGNLNGGELVFVFFAECRNGSGIVGIFLVHAVDEDDDGLFRAQAKVDRFFRTNRHRAVGARDHDRRTAGAQSFVDFAFKIIEPGDIDQIDLDVLPGDGCDRERHGHFTRDFLLVKVGNGGAVFDFSHALDDAAVKEHCLEEGCLAFAAVPDNGNIADIFCRNTHK